MDQHEYIEVVVDNEEGTLTLDQVDITEIMEMIQCMETLLFPTEEEKKVRPLISYKVENGSAKHQFFTPKITVINFNGVINEIQTSNTIDFLRAEQQQVINALQQKARKNDLSFNFYNSKNKNTFIIDKNTDYKVILPKDKFYESEFFIYGTVLLQGGKNPYITIETEEKKTINIKATKEQILNGENKLYQQWGLKVKGKKTIPDNQPYDMALIEFVGRYEPIFDQTKFNQFIENSKSNMDKIKNVDEFIKTLKGDLI